MGTLVCAHLYLAKELEIGLYLFHYNSGPLRQLYLSLAARFQFPAYAKRYTD
jgi:hypothetical protein